MSVDYTGNIRSKKCGTTGFTEDVLSQAYKRKGNTMLMIAEVKIEETREKSDGSRKVEFIIETAEPVVDGQLDGRAIDAVRRVQRALYVNRQQDQQLPLAPGDSSEPTVPETLAAMEAMVEKDEKGDVTGLWDGQNDQEQPEEPTDPGQASVEVGDPFATPDDQAEGDQEPDEPVALDSRRK